MDIIFFLMFIRISYYIDIKIGQFFNKIKNSIDIEDIYIIINKKIYSFYIVDEKEVRLIIIRYNNLFSK